TLLRPVRVPPATTCAPLPFFHPRKSKEITQGRVAQQSGHSTMAWPALNMPVYDTAAGQAKRDILHNPSAAKGLAMVAGDRFFDQYGGLRVRVNFLPARLGPKKSHQGGIRRQDYGADLPLLDRTLPPIGKVISGREIIHEGIAIQVSAAV